MARRYTRKQLKQPDEFITLSHRVWDWVSDHAVRVAVMLGVAVLIVAAGWTWSYFSEKRAQKATSALTTALETYDRNILETTDEVPKADDGIPRFKSRDAKLKAVKGDLDQVVKKHSSQLGSLANLMRASVLYDLGDYKGAKTEYEAVLKESDGKEEDVFHTMAIEGLIYALEAQKQPDAALKAVERLPRRGELRFRAIYHEARLLAEKGNKAEAEKRFREVIEKSKSQSLVKNAEIGLMSLKHA